MHPSKVKGVNFEREIIAIAGKHHLYAKRAWGSDGRSMGLGKNVDILLADTYKIQAKRVKKLSKTIKPEPDVDFQVIREDRGEALAVVRLDFLFALIATSIFNR